TIAADGDDGSATLRDLVRDPAQVAELGRSDAAPVVTIEDEDDVLALEIGQRRLTARGRRKREPGRGLTESKTGHERPPPYAMSRRWLTRRSMWLFRYTTVRIRVGKPPSG